MSNTPLKIVELCRRGVEIVGKRYNEGVYFLSDLIMLEEILNETKAPILGISVLLSFCIDSVKKVVELLEEAGLRDQVKVIVGGYPVNELVKDYTGVDYYANDVTKVYKICQQITEN